MPRKPRQLPAQNTLPYLLLTLTALCGEYPIRQISHLPGGSAYLESVVTALRRDGLLHTFSKDGLRGLRLTSSAKRLLLADTKQLPAIVKLASSSFGITEDESNGVLEHLITGGDFSLYGLANAVTRFSQDVESYDRATKLEEIGYSVMTMSPALFRQMNQTELLAA